MFQKIGRQLENCVRGNRRNIFCKPFGHDASTGRSPETMRRERLEFRIVWRVAATAGDQQCAAVARDVDEALDVRYDFFRAGDVQLASWQHEISLSVHFPENKFA